LLPEAGLERERERMNYRKILARAFEAAVEKKRLIIFFLAAHAVFLILGMLTMSWQMPGVLALRSELMKEIQGLFYVKPLTGPLATSLILKIFYTFSFNLIFGAFISTTLTGLLIFVPYVIAVWRSFVIGILFYGMDASPLQSIVFYGTAILEFGAYSFASALGTDLGLSLFFPGRKGTTSRREALRTTLAEGLWLYVIVIILIFVGAIWEISWLHYLGPLGPPMAPPG